MAVTAAAQVVAQSQSIEAFVGEMGFGGVLGGAASARVEPEIPETRGRKMTLQQ